MSAQRRAAAQAALDAPAGRSDENLLCSVRCTRSHRVAAIYATSVGPVYEALAGPNPPDRRDFAATGRHGTAVVDVLDTDNDPMGDDGLPAWCECGPRVLSRVDLREALATHRRHLLVT